MSQLQPCDEDKDGWTCECEKCNAYWESLEEPINNQSEEYDEELDYELAQVFEVDGW